MLCYYNDYFFVIFIRIATNLSLDNMLRLKAVQQIEILPVLERLLQWFWFNTHATDINIYITPLISICVYAMVMKTGYDT